MKRSSVKRPCCGVSVGLFLTMFTAAYGQRQELSVSPIGLFQPKNQLIHYERYLNTRHSLTASLAYNGSLRGYGLLVPYRTERFTTTRAVFGYRCYFPKVDDGLTAFISARAVVDYSSLKLSPDSRYNIPSDSLRATGISLAPELIFGLKATVGQRITLSGAVGTQYLFKLFPTSQITRTQQYWETTNSEYKGWQSNLAGAVNLRQGWYPSVLFTAGVILGKRPK